MGIEKEMEEKKKEAVEAAARAPILFKWQDTEYEVRRFSLAAGDFAAVREKIRRERLNSLPPHAGSEVYAKTVAQPVPEEEAFAYLLSNEGIAWAITRCGVEEGSVTIDTAERMVLGECPDIRRWLTESNLAAFPEGEEEEDVT